MGKYLNGPSSIDQKTLSYHRGFYSRNGKFSKWSLFYRPIALVFFLIFCKIIVSCCTLSSKSNQVNMNTNKVCSKSNQVNMNTNKVC